MMDYTIFLSDNLEEPDPPPNIFESRLYKNYLTSIPDLSEKHYYILEWYLTETPAPAPTKFKTRFIKTKLSPIPEEPELESNPPEYSEPVECSSPICSSQTLPPSTSLQITTETSSVPPSCRQISTNSEQSSDMSTPCVPTSAPLLSKENTSNQKPIKNCNFCQKGRAIPEVYTSHYLREHGILTCPTLRAHICSACGATGDNAHIKTYCPTLNVPARRKDKK